MDVRILSHGQTPSWQVLSHLPCPRCAPRAALWPSCPCELLGRRHTTLNGRSSSLPFSASDGLPFSTSDGPPFTSQRPTFDGPTFPSPYASAVRRPSLPFRSSRPTAVAQRMKLPPFVLLFSLSLAIEKGQREFPTKWALFRSQLVHNLPPPILSPSRERALIRNQLVDNLPPPVVGPPRSVPEWRTAAADNPFLATQPRQKPMCGKLDGFERVTRTFIVNLSMGLEWRNVGWLKKFPLFHRG